MSDFRRLEFCCHAPHQTPESAVESAAPNAPKPTPFPPQVHDRTLHTDIFTSGPLNAIRFAPWGGALGCAGGAGDGTVRLFDVDTVGGFLGGWGWVT